MNTPKEKGDILAARIEKVTTWLQDTSPSLIELKKALAEYRAPWTLGRSVNGFTLADGQEWHRQDFTEDMLPGVRRPRLLGEGKPAEFECKHHSRHAEWGQWIDGQQWALESEFFFRTTRPLPSVAKPILTPDQIAAGWVEWHGGECPVWGGSSPKILYRSGYPGVVNVARSVQWNHTGEDGDITAYLPDPFSALKQAHSEGMTIQWRFKGGRINDVWHTCPIHHLWQSQFEYRIAPSPAIVALGPEDVPPGSVIRYPNHNTGEGHHWILVCAVNPTDIAIKVAHEIGRITYANLKSKGCEISRDGGNTWQKCEKEAK